MNSFFKNLVKQNSGSTSNYEFGSFEDSRVNLNPNPPHRGDTMHINYQGLLKNSGAQAVYLHYGFDNWSTEVTTVQMERQGNGEFAATIPSHDHNHHEINFCFKDCANNWDNNSGWNWTAAFH